jgi:hypothetical protein
MLLESKVEFIVSFLIDNLCLVYCAAQNKLVEMWKL